jgi:hypothetical protein
MAQTQSPTNEGYGELGKFLAGEAATKMKSVVVIKTSCTADESQTAAGITKCTDTGLDLQDADTVASAKTTVTADTVQIDNKFTAATGDTVKGFGWLNDDDDVLYGICCFAADIVLAASDTLTVQAKNQFKKGT